ncbi:MAG: alcohol dehydrogenase catalytic domain-containing protein [Acidobacteriaceae bacterium]
MFKAVLIQRDAAGSHATQVELDRGQLPAGEVKVEVDYSSLHYKDALAVMGRGAILKRWPLVPGIDLAGVVVHCESSSWKTGDTVVVTGWGLDETHWGGYAQRAHLAAEWLLKNIPASYDSRLAMAVGTAGLTAALCVMALQRHGLQPGDGPVLVTGASGSVGSIALVLLAGLGYEVVASSGRAEQTNYRRGLGAGQIVERRTGDAGPALAKRTLGGCG